MLPYFNKTLCLALLLLCSAVSPAQKPKEYKAIVPVLKRMIEINHCNARVFNETVEKSLLRDFINRLDKEHLYFTQADVKQLQDMLPQMHDELAGKNTLFLDKALLIYKSRLQKTDTLVNSLLQKPFDFTQPGEIVFANDSSSFAAGESEWQTRWGKWLKYKMLYRLSNLMLADSTLSIAGALKQEAAQRELVRKSEQRKINGLLQHNWGYENYVAYLFCNALANVFDPHTEFFPAVDKENFVGAVSGESYSFGLQLDQNDKDEIEISHIQPGSPAWKSGDLNKNDVLLQLQWEGKAKVDLEGAGGYEVSALLAEMNHQRLSLTVRKANGIQKTVTLLKEKIHDEENFVKSFVLDGDRRVGYIVLPGFYTEWETTNGSSCANDVAKEILKLKKENIEGLILDLRNNGGGSMEEAMQLAGIFIEEGVLGFEKEKEGKALALKDPNRGTVYDGPLLVMVNGSSASASEMVAGALQDYNRALIVGNPTYGKATMQVVLPLDTSLSLLAATKSMAGKNNYDYAKITMGKLYRVNGSSNQLRGVIPDITLPDIAALLNYRESSQDWALTADSVKKALYFSPLSPLPVSVLAAKSAARVKTDSGFELVKRSQPLVADMYNLTSLPLQFDLYLRHKKEVKNAFSQLGRQMESQKPGGFTIINNAADRQRLAADEYLSENNQLSVKSMLADIYLHESFLILADYIQLPK